MIEIVAKHKPRKVVEVGVHRAVRAVRLCNEAAQHSPSVEYVGYDVFETLGEVFQEEALNGKGMTTEADARHKLQSFKMKMPGFSYSLVIGDTRDTLHGTTVEADFAFIDGDHRVEAIAGDYEALKDCPVVVFDDYYVPGADGSIPDLALYGANATVEAAKTAGHKVDILPVGDVCKHGGVSHLAVVYK